MHVALLPFARANTAKSGSPQEQGKRVGLSKLVVYKRGILFR